jgi:hypothetical protein
LGSRRRWRLPSIPAVHTWPAASKRVNATALPSGLTIGELVSPRLGCRRQAPFSFGDELARLCLAHG